MFKWLKVWWIHRKFRSRVNELSAEQLCAAARALGEVGSPRATAPLIKMLAWGPGVRNAAIKALDVLGDARAVKPLIKALRDDKNGERGFYAAKALGELRDPRAIRPLLKAFEDHSRHFHKRIVAALDELCDLISISTLIKALREEDSSALRCFASRALGERGDARAVKPLMKALGDGHYGGVSAAAAEALDRLGELCTFKTLTKALENEDGHTRSYAVSALGRRADGRAVEPLIHALWDKEMYVQRTAKEALCRLGDARSVEPLTQALGDDDFSVRRAAIEVLAALGDLVGHELFMRALGDTAWGVRGIAIEALKKRCAPSTVEALIKALRDEQRMRHGAAEALGILCDARAVEPLIDTLRDGASEVRHAAAEALGLLGDARAVEPFIEALGDADHAVRVVAATALGQLADVRAIEPLMRPLCDRYTDVRCAAAKALAALGQPGWQEAIRGQLGDYVRLVRMGLPGAIEPLISNALDDGEWLVRSAAIRLLGDLGDARAVEPLIEVLKTGPYVVCNDAAHALGVLRDARAVEPLIDALSAGWYLMRCAAIDALAALGDARAIEPLIDVLGHGHYGTRRAAAAALAALGQPVWQAMVKGSPLEQNEDFTRLGADGDARAIGPLLVALGSCDGDVRRAAAKALAALGEALWEGLVRGDNQDFHRLGASGDPRAVKPLAHALSTVDEEQSESRRAASKALVALDTQEAVKPLVRLLQRPGQECGAWRAWSDRRAAAEALAAIARRHPSWVSRSWADIRDLVAEPHRDDHNDRDTGRSSDCVHIDNHTDAGIGMKWPEGPPASGDPNGDGGVPRDF